MSADPPPSSPNQPIPPRHRPTLSSFVKDTTEEDLWAFDEELDAPEEPAASQPPATSSWASGKDLPAPRERPESIKSGGGGPRPPAEEQIRININKAAAPKSRNSGNTPARGGPVDDLDDIEEWDDHAEPPAPGPVTDSAAATDTLPQPAPEPPAPVGPAARASAEAVAPPAAAEAEDTAEPVPAPAIETKAAAPAEATVFMGLRRNWKLTPVERLGLLVLTLLLVGGAAWMFLLSIRVLPRESERANVNDFPLRGKHLTVSAAETYWRAPQASDTAQLRVQLLPVLQLTVHGGPAAIRVYFRNDDGAVVGDPVTRTVRDGQTLQIPATGGFDDLGMHAAYRTGQSQPWVAEVLEAPREDAPGAAFERLFAMDVSTDRR